MENELIVLQVETNTTPDAVRAALVGGEGEEVPGRSLPFVE